MHRVSLMTKAVNFQWMQSALSRVIYWTSKWRMQLICVCQVGNMLNIDFIPNGSWMFRLNRWTIKNSESLLRALSANRPSFPNDKEIELLVKESDEWQSYKRDAVCDAFALKHKRASRIIHENDIPRTLDTAIKQGSILRYYPYNIWFSILHEELSSCKLILP